MSHLNSPLPSTPVVDATQWLQARRQLLARERELMHLHDAVAAERRALPWTAVTQPYTFDTPDGPRTLAELFDGRRQLLVQHFMFGPGWAQGCPSCSYMADHMGGMQIHLAHRDTSFVAISRAPMAEIEAFRQRMGWDFRWVSSHGSDFNYDFHVSFRPEETATGEVDYNYRRQPFPSDEAPGLSIFVRDDEGRVFHTYSTYARGVEAMMGTYQLLDLTPKGRDERDTFYKMEWVRHHDRYEDVPFAPAPTAPAKHADAATAASSAPAGVTATAGACCHR